MKPEKESNEDKIKRALWIYEELIDRFPTMYRILKERYDQIKKRL